MTDGLSVLSGGTLVDGNGGHPVHNSVVAFRRDKIVYAGPMAGFEMPRPCVGVDVTGKTVMPGLIDGHVHLLAYAGAKKTDIHMWNVVTFIEEQTLHAYKNAKKALLSGVTGLRDMAGSRPEIAVKNAVDDGVLPGPRIVTSGMVGMTAGHSDMFVPPMLERRLWQEADGPYECRKLVRRYVRDGVDFIKVCTSGGTLSIGDAVAHRNYTDEELLAIVDEAHALGKPVAAHAHTRESIRRALMAGVDTIEHGSDLDEELIETMLKNDVWLCPALLISQFTQEFGKARGIPAASLEKSRATHRTHIESTQRAHKAGVKIFMGTDSCNTMPFGNHAREVELLVSLGGLSAMQAIVAATRNGARALGIDHITGTLEPNKKADILVVDGDPLVSPEILQDRIVRVYKDGVPVLSKSAL